MLRFLSRTLPRELATPQAPLHSLALRLSRGSGSAAANSVVQPLSSISALSLPEQQRLSSSVLAAAAVAGLQWRPLDLSGLKNRAMDALLPPLTAAWTLLPELMPSIVLTGKKKHHGKNKRYPKAANHGARPCSHIGRKQRAAAEGRWKYNPKR